MKLPMPRTLFTLTLLLLFAAPAQASPVTLNHKTATGGAGYTLPYFHSVTSPRRIAARFQPQGQPALKGPLSLWSSHWDSPGQRGSELPCPDPDSSGVDYAPGWGVDYEFDLVATPEPGTAVLLGGAILFLGATRRKVFRAAP